jgi:dihydrofolate synthase/folylpolyglutamate synthase
MTTPSAGLTYQEALAALAERGRFGMRLGLGRTRALLRELGNPERSVRGALVGGTNGKGSVLALADAALRAAGLHVGTTPKPHLVTYRERICIDGAPISADDFARLVSDVLPVAERVARRHGAPTEFELLTAIVFARFAEARPDVAVVEVGLGGRLDATHAWDGGVAAITNVDLDHMDRLGDTIAEIAREKAAIIERGDLAVTGARGDGLAVIRRRARRVGAPLTVVEPAPLLGWDRDGIEVELPRLGRTRVGLRGRHQAANVATADAVLDALEAAGIATVGGAARRTGYASANWPGRLELLTVGGRDVLLDGAHNPAGAAALAVALDDLRPYLAEGPLTLITASMADKDVDGVIEALVGRGASTALAAATVVCTTVPGLDRALPADDLAARWGRATAGLKSPRGTSGPRRPAISIEADPLVALDRAIGNGRGPVVVAGSLYLVGMARGHLVDDPALRDPEAAAGTAGAVPGPEAQPAARR